MSKVTLAESKLKKWNDIIDNLYNKYDELAFFSVSKLLLIYEMLKNKFSAFKTVQEIGFLFRNEDTVMEKIKIAVEVSLYMLCTSIYSTINYF